MSFIRWIRYGAAYLKWYLQGSDLIVEPVPGNSGQEQQILLSESVLKDSWLAQKPKPEHFGLRSARLFT